MEVIATEHPTETPPGKRRALTPWAVDLACVLIALAIGIATYFIISRYGMRRELLTPPTVAILLVANLLAWTTVLVMFGRRIARHRAQRLGMGSRAQLHVRLVVIFSVLASVPTVLLAVVASLLFQYGAEFWFSGRAQAMIENSRQLAQDSYAQLLADVDKQNVAMAMDVHRMLFNNKWKIDSPSFKSVFEQSASVRNFENSVMFKLSEDGKVIPAIVYQTTDSILTDKFPAEELDKLRDSSSVANTDARRTYALTYVPGTDYLLYSTRERGAAEMQQRLDLEKSVWKDYQELVARSRSIQLQFNAALLLISFLVIAIVVFVALAVADRLVRPVDALVTAARQVASGDLTARVPEPATMDEIGTLGSAFNRMTERLQEQNRDLVTANAQIESRRALIEAVMSGVTAGVVSIDADRRVRVINQSAMQLLRTGDASPIGAPLSEIAPDLAALLDGDAREAVVQVTTGGEARTLAVKITTDEDGQVLTFDDITQQLLDQRRAAWSDVARRIAHEIKNPLTPIQLAAERLQRRYGKQVDLEGEGVFQRLTETIVRQVGDLRRMVDEFSSFARMPKPVFRRESVLDIARQALFLHEVAHPAIRFALDAPDPAPGLVCDRRQIGQALTNVVKNAVEAIEARGEGEALPRGEVVMTIARPDERQLVLTVADNGIGLPVERDRIAEPYMTTRSRGTGLGLAIVKKIVEEHCGTIVFSDRPGGGTLVTLNFDTGLLDNFAAQEAADAEPAEDTRPPALTRTGNSKP